MTPMERAIAELEDDETTAFDEDERTGPQLIVSPEELLQYGW